MAAELWHTPTIGCPPEGGAVGMRRDELETLGVEWVRGEGVGGATKGLAREPIPLDTESMRASWSREP